MITPQSKNTFQSAKAKFHKSVEVKTIVQENDPANLRLYEAFYIRNYKPAIKSLEECNRSADPLFQ